MSFRNQMAKLILCKNKHDFSNLVWWKSGSWSYLSCPSISASSELVCLPTSGSANSLFLTSLSACLSAHFRALKNPAPNCESHSEHSWYQLPGPGGNCAIGHAAQCFNSRNQECNNWCYLHYLALAQKNPIIYRKCYQIGMMEPQFYLLPLWNLSCQIQFLFNSNFIYTASCGASSTTWSARLIIGIICLLHLEFCETYLSWLYRQTYLECSQGRYVH